MNRIALSDGRWFDKDKARKYGEAREHDGNNYISKTTGSQWDHEALYLTAMGAWVLYRWSQYQGRLDTHKTIEPEQAARWLIRNDEELPESLAQFEQELEV